MKNWVGVYKIKIIEGNGERVASLLRQVGELNIPGCVTYNISINGDTICGYEEWESKEAHAESMKIPDVIVLVKQAFPLMDGSPEMLFEGESA